MVICISSIYPSVVSCKMYGIVPYIYFLKDSFIFFIYPVQHQPLQFHSFLFSKDVQRAVLLYIIHTLIIYSLNGRNRFKD